MSSDPAVSGKTAVRALQKLGFRLDRIEGSHHVLIKSGNPYPVVVPVHSSQALPKGTLASIIRIARVSKKQFFAAIR
jgi:predicted RNA binding protein YcfA (HicA-like mRNA interferase family)